MRTDWHKEEDKHSWLSICTSCRKIHLSVQIKLHKIQEVKRCNWMGGRKLWHFTRTSFFFSASSLVFITIQSNVSRDSSLKQSTWVYYRRDGCRIKRRKRRSKDNRSWISLDFYMLPNERVYVVDGMSILLEDTSQRSCSASLHISLDLHRII